MASSGEIVLSYYDTLLRKSDLSLLNDKRWINDNLISFWYDYLENDLYKEFRQLMTLLSPQVAQFIKSAASFEHNLSDVSTMLKDMNLQNKRLIFIPVNDCIADTDVIGGTHWSLLVYIASKQSFEHYDSHTGSVNRYHAEHIVRILAPILIEGHVFDIELDLTEMECTQQSNSYDCGVHLICNSEAICRKHFRNDNRHICDISSPTVIRQARRDIFKLIHSIKQKNEDATLLPDID